MIDGLKQLGVVVLWITALTLTIWDAFGGFTLAVCLSVVLATTLIITLLSSGDEF
jgi:hypothetical protein